MRTLPLNFSFIAFENCYKDLKEDANEDDADDMENKDNAEDDLAEDSLIIHFNSSNSIILK